MTSPRYFGHVTLPDGCDWLKSAAKFLLSIDQTLLLPLTVNIHYFKCANYILSNFLLFKFELIGTNTFWKVGSEVFTLEMDEYAFKRKKSYQIMLICANFWYFIQLEIHENVSVWRQRSIIVKSSGIRK